MWIKSKNIKTKITTSFVISLTIHFVFAIFFVHNKITSEDKYKKIILEQSSKKNLVDLAKVKVISHKELEKIKKQIVANELTGKKIKPEKTKFSGEKDQSFDRQTIARNLGTFNAAGKGNAANEVVASKPLENTHPQKKSAPKNLKLSDLGGINLNTKVEVASDEEVEKEFNRHLKNAQKNAVQGALNGSENSVGLASSNDYVEEVALGDVTNLNMTENKYYGFYHRIRQKLEQYWGSTIHDRAKSLYKSGRRLPASENLITAITVILNEKGNILDIKIEGTSGVRELDQAAVESFNKAGPFPNPPKGLLVDGRAVIQWGFVVKS